MVYSKNCFYKKFKWTQNFTCISVVVTLYVFPNLIHPIAGWLLFVMLRSILRLQPLFHTNFALLCLKLVEGSDSDSKTVFDIFHAVSGKCRERAYRTVQSNSSSAIRLPNNQLRCIIAVFTA